MLTVEDYRQIRNAHRDGMSIRVIARTYHHSRRKIRQVLEESEPRPYTRQKEPLAPKLGLFQQVIRQILADDEQAPRKQRHTAARIHRRLRDEHGLLGGDDQVRRYVKRHRKRSRETFIPLAHAPGRRLEADFGHIYVDFPDGRRQGPSPGGIGSFGGVSPMETAGWFYLAAGRFRSPVWPLWRVSSIHPGAAVVGRASGPKSTASDRAVPQESPTACRSDYSNHAASGRRSDLVERTDRSITSDPASPSGSSSPTRLEPV